MEVTLPYLIFHSEPHFGHRDAWVGGGGGGELVKEVDFVFMFCYYFVQAHFVMFSGLLGPLSIKLLYIIAYFFKIWTRFCNKNFLWFCLTCGLKN